MFIGIELVEDRATKAPFSPERKLAASIKRDAFDSGLICYPMSGTRDGKHGDHILLAPPFIMESDHVPMVVDVLKTVIARQTSASP
jgi:adenosylmethionine-8-amino-7-oxononanoate aminotransferase